MWLYLWQIDVLSLSYRSYRGSLRARSLGFLRSLTWLEWSCFRPNQHFDQWEFQDPKMEVYLPYIYIYIYGDFHKWGYP